jgi:hypothetical protein
LEAETPARLVMPKATNFERRVRFFVEELRVGRVGARIAALDIVHAELVQHRGDGDLVLDREVDARRLLAVAQRGVEKVEALRSWSEMSAGAPPSVLPDISPTRGEIGSFAYRCALVLQRWRLAKAVRQADLPPCGGDVRQDRGGRCPAILSREPCIGTLPRKLVRRVDQPVENAGLRIGVPGPLDQEKLRAGQALCSSQAYFAGHGMS